MAKIQLFLMIFGVLFACSRDLPNQNFESSSGLTVMGTREIELDPLKAFVVVSVYGVSMGTPDQASVENLLEQAKNDSTVADYNKTASGIEGGGTYCVELSSDVNYRKAFFYELEKLAIDISATNFQALSRNNCF